MVVSKVYENSPQALQREGTLAFKPGLDPEEECPYAIKTHWNQIRRANWIEGWKQKQRSLTN